MPILPSSPDAFLNQLAWRMAAGIAAGAALVAVILASNGPASAKGILPAAPAPLPPAAPPQELREELSLGGDLARCIDFCAQHVTTERSFVVFSNGTCVIVDEPSDQPVVDAIHTLEDCSGPNARFITRGIEDGHFLVTYRRAAFHCIFAEEISSQRDLIERTFLAFLTPGERRNMPPAFDPPFNAKLGLVARARLNRDAQELTVAKVIRARPTATPPPAEPNETEDPLHEGSAFPFPPPGGSLPAETIPDGTLLPPKDAVPRAIPIPEEDPGEEGEFPAEPGAEPSEAAWRPPAPERPRSHVNVFEGLAQGGPPTGIE